MTDEERISGVDGLTLRDWFAGQALAGLLASGEHRIPTNHGVDFDCLRAARNAYEFAEEMLDERAEADGP